MVLEEKKDLHKKIKTHFSLSFKIYTYYQWQIQIYFTIETCNKTPLQFISRIILHKIPANLDGNLALLEPFNVANSKLSVTPVGQLQEDWGRCAQILPPPPHHHTSCGHVTIILLRLTLIESLLAGYSIQRFSHQNKNV